MSRFANVLVNIPDHHVTESTLQDDTLGVEDAPVEADTKELSSDEKVATEVPAPLEDVPAEEEEEEIVDNEATVGAATSDEGFYSSHYLLNSSSGRRALSY